jgi:hypothetical protein
MAGVARTDWSWSALIADLDLDGLKDIFVTNGILRDLTSQDYIAFLANDETMKSVTEGGRARADFERLTKAMSQTPLPDYAFRNDGNLRFTNVAEAWGLAEPTFSSGAAYGDLDGDGALDLVVNNVNAEAFVFRNNARTLHPSRLPLRVRLEGESNNRFALGARVSVHAGSDVFVQEQSASRGFQSSVDYVLGFGLGTRSTIDSVVVRWPDGRQTTKTGVKAGELVVIAQRGAARASERDAAPPAILEDVSRSVSLDFRHRENAFVDFDRERLIPKLVSTDGPMMAVGDVNGDGLDDIYFGGAKEQAGKLLLQDMNGRFSASSAAVFEQDATSEDAGAAFFDADGDRDLDLYVVSGGNEFSAGAPALQDRLYLNDGRGRFSKSEGRIPAETNSGSVVAPGDFDGDGDMDLFVGGRVVPWRYGTDPRSALLRNDGHGRFTDVTASVAPSLETVGMVTDAVWRDVDGDARADLVLVGEWMPISVFRNAGGRLAPLSASGLAKSHGWWNRIVAGDFTGDGRIDFLVGNLGLNTRLRASDDEPATMLVKDFDGNGFAEQVVATYNRGKSYPIVLRDDLIKSIPPLKARFLKYADYATKTVSEIFPATELAGAVAKTTHTFASALVRNDGEGAFTVVPLPDEAQIAPVYGILADDFDGDGHLDALLAGNFDGFEPKIGRASAGYGVFLRGDGKGAFTPVHVTTSGFFVPGETRDLRRLRTKTGALYVASRNDDTPLVFRRREGTSTVATSSGDR